VRRFFVSRCTAEGVPDAVLVADPRGTVLLANRQAAELFGHPSPEALTGRSILALVALSDRERARVALRQMAAG
jgi:PAS domain S-box-containing protein